MESAQPDICNRRAAANASTSCQGRHVGLQIPCSQRMQPFEGTLLCIRGQPGLQ